jgi:hypothetical protein|tara:strand:+ start:2534 stop:3385 length:852 start_codon:yes stop_codon:yes gene_type:complete
MIEQFQHKLTTSFFLWFDNFLLTKGQAFSNKTGQLFYYEDPRLDSRYLAYGSPYKQWVTDSSIAGATIPTGVSVVGAGTSGRDDGVVFDFDNGRALFSGENTSMTVTGEFAVKDFNVYLTNDTEDDLIVENKYEVNSRLPSGPLTYIQPYDDVVPAIFLSVAQAENEPFALGGMQTTKTQAKAVILAEDTYQLDGVISIFMDSVDEVIAAIPMSGYPIDELGDLKDGEFNYSTTSESYNTQTKFCVEKVRTSKLSDRTRNVLANELYVGFIDFDIEQQRYRFQ